MTLQLQTARLTLRRHRLEDYDDCCAMWGDPGVTRHIGGKPFTREEVWHRLLRYAGHWALMGFGYWAARETATGLFVGEMGLADFKRELTPSLGGAPEIGWALAPAFHGKGLATEAVRAVVAWGEAHFSGARTVCLIDPANAASLRVAEKCGYRELARTTYKGAPSILFERSGAGK